MVYRFAHEREDYSDLAAGRVFQGAPGYPAFPVRLTSEIFQRCKAILRGQGNNEPSVVYDPCCGSGYLLGTLAMLHWNDIRRVLGSDVDPGALRLAERNLSLLTIAGLDERLSQIETMIRSFGKASHAEALESAQRLKKLLLERSANHTVTARVLQADALSSPELADSLNGERIDIVMTDVPYGQNHILVFSSDTAVDAQQPFMAFTRHVTHCALPRLSCSDLREQAAEGCSQTLPAN